MLKFFENFKMVNDTKNLKSKQQQYCQTNMIMLTNGGSGGGHLVGGLHNNNNGNSQQSDNPTSGGAPTNSSPANNNTTGTTGIALANTAPTTATTTAQSTPPPHVSSQTTLGGGGIHRPSPIKKVTIISAKSEGSPQSIHRPQRLGPPQTDFELIAATPNERNWRGILIALLVIVAVLGMIVFSIVLVTPIEDGPRVKGRRPTLSETLTLQRLAEKPFNGSWISDSELVYRDPHGGITVLNVENMTARVLMTNSTFRQLNAVDFKVSSDLKYVLLIADIQKVHKYTTLARYYVYEVATRAKFPLSPKEDDPTAPLLQYAVWSPDGRAVAFVHENDVYYKPRVRKALVCRITNSAEQNNRVGAAPIIRNGIPDWLYEHEIMSSNGGAALWFSPDSQYLVYLLTNNTEVGTYKYPWYGGYGHNDFSDLKYPEIREVKYPKVGTPNPNVTIWSVNLNRPKYLFPQPVRPPPLKGPTLSESELISTFNYVTSVKWFAEHHLAIMWLNRAQNQSILGICKAPNFNCTVVHTERPENAAWVHISNDWNGPVYNQQGDSLHLLPVRDGEFGNYLHLCHIDASQHEVTPLTHGRFEVTDILGWDESNHIIYAIATPELKPAERHLYRIGDKNSSIPWQCLTCPDDNVYLTNNNVPLNLLVQLNSTITVSNEEQILDNIDKTSPENNETLICLYNKIIFSPDFRFFVQECLGPSPPFVSLYDTQTGVRLQLLDPGTAIRSKLKHLAQPQIRNYEVEIEDGYQAQIRLLLPPGLREDEDIMFPLILLIDAAPGSQTVSEKWSSGWPWYLAANKSFIVALVDGRGSGFQGERMRTEIHHRLGSVEVQDQLSVLTYLRNSLKCISPIRICVAGITSYGSYAALTLLATDTSKVVNCTVALSPITNWRLHNTYFTERYLGFSPTDYLHADMVTSQRAQSITPRRLLLAHGTADTVVHSQHSMSLASLLIKHEALFTYLAYPDIGHDFDGVQHHLYKQIDSFFENTFDLDYDFDRWDQTPESDPATDFFISFRQ